MKQLNIHCLCVLSESVQKAPQGLTVEKSHGQQQHMVQQPGMHLLRRTVTTPYCDEVTQHTDQHDREGECSIDLEVMDSGLGMRCWVDALKKKSKKKLNDKL